jgi:SIR2-like domain
MTDSSRTFPLATYLSNQLITKTAVFIGYSLDDPDFRQL